METLSKDNVTPTSVQLTASDLLKIHRGLCKLDDSYTNLICDARDAGYLSALHREREATRVACRKIATAYQSLTGVLL